MCSDVFREVFTSILEKLMFVHVLCGVFTSTARAKTDNSST